MINLKSRAIEAGIRYLGGINEEEFVTAAGNLANRKVELDVLEKSHLVKALVTSALVDLMMPYEPDLIVPIPTGADSLGELTADRLGIECAHLKWTEKTHGYRKLIHRTHADLLNIRNAGRIMLIDDVFTTGSSLLAAFNRPNIGEKTVGSAVVWDRSDVMARQNFPMPLESIVEKYIPLWTE